MIVITRKTPRALLASTSALALALGGALVVSSPATAASFTANDETELAAAITAANAAADLDTITLTDNILLTADLPSITESLEIIGNGYSIDGGGYDVFYDDDATSITNLTFTGVSVMNTEAAIVTSYSITVSITDSVFEDALVDIYGDGGNTLDVTGSEFNNASDGHGLSVSVRDISDVTIEGSSATGNSRNGFDINLVINSTMSLTGSTANNNSRNGFEVDAGLDAVATLSGLTATGNTFSGLRGIADVASTITVSDSTFSESGGFGVVLNPTDDSTISLERIASHGNDGGIRINDSGYVGDHSTVTITGCTIDGNDETGIFIIDGGAGLSNPGATSLDITVQDSTISNNVSTTAGGIFAALSDASSLSIDNSTISGNEQFRPSAVTIAGTSDPTASVSFTHSTIVDNHSTTPSSIGFVGGVTLAQVQYEIDHSIIAGNTSGGAPSDFIFGGGPLPTGTVNFSLVQVPFGSAGIAVDAGTGNLKNMGAQLGALANNGGPTLTHLPQDGSPVINVGNPAITGAPATDQRGQTRIVGTIDLGAVEVQPALAATGADAALPIAGGALALGLGILLLLVRRRALRR